VRRERVSLIAALRKAVARHLARHLVVYVPALLPLVLFFLAHGVTLLTLICIKSGVLQQGYLMHKTVVTWAVYGFLPLLLCSYGCFFAVARPATGMLERRFPEWPPLKLTLMTGAAYGAAVGLALLVLLEPRSLFRALFLLVIGMATGQGNWFLYRKLTVTADAKPTSSRPVTGSDWGEGM